MIDVRRRFSPLARRTPGFFFVAEKASSHGCHCGLLCTAQSISMQLNGLSLKRDDTFEPSGFIHTGTLRPEIFCNFPQQPEDFDPAIFSPFWAPDGLARNQAVTHATGSCIFASGNLIISLIHQAVFKDSLNCACGLPVCAKVSFRSGTG